jgi:NADPH:quinone reductase-like Zn-dependent oxidoreductase
MQSATMRTVRFYDYGEPGEVLRMDQVVVPDPGPDRIRVLVRACGLNPADWALCRGLFPGALPRGVGLEVSGVVDAVGPGVAVLTISDLAAAGELGARDSFHEEWPPRRNVLGEFAQLAADGQFTIPVARTFPLEDWRAALDISQGGHARGKLVLLPTGTDVIG